MDKIEFICPMCLKIVPHDRHSFPQHCGHYMVEKYIWDKDPEMWLKSREYELSKLNKQEAADAEK